MCEYIRLTGMVEISANVTNKLSVHNVSTFLSMETSYALVGDNGTMESRRDSCVVREEKFLV